MKTLVILNDSPYGSERTYNGVRLAAALARQEGNEVRLFLIGGHTVDSVCLLVRDLRRGDEPWFVITGDTLFVGAVGRPDLAGREREMAAQPYDTLHGKLLTLPAELEIYPGHQAGSACGAGLSGKPASTIGFEKRFNPMLAMSREAFVDAVTAGIPPQPQDMARIVAANLRGIAPRVAYA